MIAFFVDAIGRADGTRNHVAYNEQGAALAACGYSKITGNVSVAYATSGPGVVNLIQGIADAYYDSVPVLFITGQVNLNEINECDLRQHSFQEIPAVDICKSITKKSFFVTDAKNIGNILDEAFSIMQNGRPGPVLIDIPMNIQRAEVDLDGKNTTVSVSEGINDSVEQAVFSVFSYLKEAQRPVFLLGNGISKSSQMREALLKLSEKFKIPCLTTMLGMDLLPFDNKYNFGSIGYAYGKRYSNFIINKKCDLIISLGARLCTRQTGVNRSEFAKKSRIVRIDIDKNETSFKVHDDDVIHNVDVNKVIEALVKKDLNKTYDEWLECCNVLRMELEKIDVDKGYFTPNRLIEKISETIPSNSNIVCDVGQHQVWMMLSFNNKEGQRVLFSGGHGAMGFALPASIGAFYANEKFTICVTGDGSFQMNIQELQWVARDRIPLLIIILNNCSLGLIRQQQDGLFESRYYGSSPQGGYDCPSFKKIADSYGIKGFEIPEDGSFDDEIADIMQLLTSQQPVLVNINISRESLALPKTAFGDEMDNQYPKIARSTYDYLLSL